MRVYICSALFLALMLSGCKIVETQTKDLSIQDMDMLEEKYIGKKAWTRSLLINIKSGQVESEEYIIIDRDIEVQIITIDMHWNGAVAVRGPKRKVVRHALNIKRPLTVESFEEALSRVLWFKNPDYRYRMDLRAFGKKTARAIREHELFNSMLRDAALASWGHPDEIKRSEIGEFVTEQWLYRDPRQKTSKRYIYLKDFKVDRWED